MSDALKWQEQARCRGLSPEKTDEYFFGKAKSKQKLAVKAFCNPCPVRQQCLDFAIANESKGIAGGTTEAEREQMVVRDYLVHLQVTKEQADLSWEAAKAFPSVVRL